ncbi:MAG: hypothetical protein JWQ02_2125 [Capsulimonas sp.]|nr:hypothetical protein [Capsulimonas sp.]
MNDGKSEAWKWSGADAVVDDGGGAAVSREPGAPGAAGVVAYALSQRDVRSVHQYSQNQEGTGGDRFIASPGTTIYRYGGWGNVQGLYDSGRATLTQRNLAAARGTAEVVGLATSAVGAGAGIRLVARNYGEKQLLKALAKESTQQLISHISGKGGSFNRFWGTAGDDAIQAIGDVRRAKFYHLPRGADRRALLTYREIIRRNIGKRLSQNIANN